MLRTVTHSTCVNAWRYAVTRADRKDLGRLLAPLEKPEKRFERVRPTALDRYTVEAGVPMRNGGTIVFDSGVENPCGNRWGFTSRDPVTDIIKLEYRIDV